LKSFTIIKIINILSSNFFDLDKNTLMMAQIPEKLAKDLYSCLITNVSSYISEQKTIMRGKFSSNKDG